MTKQVFISYKSEDFAQADWVRSTLEKHGLSCWMAPMCIPGGSSYAMEIPKAISQCTYFVLILSDKAQRSKWVIRELDRAINEDKRVLPFAIENCPLTPEIQFYLANIQYYYAYADKTAAMEKLLADIQPNSRPVIPIPAAAVHKPVLPVCQDPAVLKKHQQLCASVSGMVGIGAYHTVALRADGKPLVTRYPGQDQFNRGQCNLDGWEDLIAVAAGELHTVGLRADGKVIAVGDNSAGQCQTEHWTDVVAIAAGNLHTVGLRSDGTVLATAFRGDPSRDFGQCDVDNWRDIVAISAKQTHTLGLKADGTVVASGHRRALVSGWTNIVALSGSKHTVGLRSDGTVVAAGDNSNGQCDVDNWRDIVAIAAAHQFTLGVKADGTVLCTRFRGEGSTYGEREVGNWKNVVAVFARTFHTVALRSDGVVMATGANSKGQSNVDGWKLFDSVYTLAQARRAVTEKCMDKALAKARLQQWQANGLCRHCGGQLKGIFLKKCSACGRIKDY